MPVILWVYFHFDPSTGVFFPKCPVRSLLGIPCPGCGSQRALHSLLHLDFAMAWKYNAMLVLTLPILALLVIASLLRERLPRLYEFTHKGYFATAFAVLIPLWWLLRIVFHWYV